MIPFHRARTRHRAIFVGGFLLCTGLIGAALYFQHIAGLAPCPLCIIQRIAFIAIGALMLCGALHNPRGWGRRIYAALATVFAAIGAAVAARHVWLQNLPPGQTPECGPGLEYLLDVFPLQQAIALVLRGSGECAEVQWQLMHLSMPAWSLAWLAVLAVLAIWLMMRRD